MRKELICVIFCVCCAFMGNLFSKEKTEASFEKFPDWVNRGKERLPLYSPQKIVPVRYQASKLVDRKKSHSAKQEKGDKKSSALMNDFFAQKPEALSEWLDKLSKDDSANLKKTIDADLEKLNGKRGESQWKKIFMRYSEVFKGIIATPDNPVENPVKMSLLNLEAACLANMPAKDLKNYGSHRLAASLGKIPEDAKPVRKIIKINSKKEKMGDERISTGMYALPGKPVTIAIGKSGAGMKIQVGHHLNGAKALVAMPGTTRYFPVKGSRSVVISPHGGLILLIVPRDVEMKETPVTLDGAIEAPRFVLGEMTNEQWKTERKAPAPWGELISKNLILVVGSEDLRKLDNPVELMTWWNENCRRHHSFYSYNPGKPFRMHVAIYGRQGFSYNPLEWDPVNTFRVLDLERLKLMNDGLFLHEHGHHADFNEMELSNWRESTPNWGGFYMKSLEPFEWKESPDDHIVGILDREDDGKSQIKKEGWYANPNGPHGFSYDVTSIILGYTEDFGWEPLIETIRRLRDRGGDMYKWGFTGNNMDDQAKIDRYLIGLSEGAKRDVRPYFEHFKMRPSQGAAAYLDRLKLPTWDLSYLPYQGELTTASGAPLVVQSGKDDVLSMDASPSIEWTETTKEGGSVVNGADGHVTYTPKAGFTGTDELSYVLGNSKGKSPLKYLKVKVE